MQTESPQTRRPADRPNITRTCPSCRCALVRQRRRIVDRLYSLFRPIKRYRCQNFACQWVGNFASTKAMRGMDPQPHRVPAVFVVHMALVAAGVVAVMVFSTLEPTGWADDDTPTAQTVTQTPTR